MSFTLKQNKTYSLFDLGHMMARSTPDTIILSETLFEGTDVYSSVRVCEEDFVKTFREFIPRSYSCVSVQPLDEDNRAKHFRFEKFGDKAGYVDVTVFNVLHDDFLCSPKREEPHIQELLYPPKYKDELVLRKVDDKFQWCQIVWDNGKFTYHQSSEEEN